MSSSATSSSTARSRNSRPKNSSRSAAAKTLAASAYPVCRHVKENGAYCNSPALKERDRCYFHLRAQGQRLRAAHYALRGAPATVDLPLLEDAWAVQSGLQRVLEAVAADQLDRKRAGLLLYGLQLASANLDRMAALQEASTQQDTETCEAYPGYEQEFELGEHARPAPSAEEIAVVAARRRLKMVAGVISTKIEERYRQGITLDDKENLREYWQGANAIRALDFALAALRDREAQGSAATAFSAPPPGSTRIEAVSPDKGFERVAGSPYPGCGEPEGVPKTWRAAVAAIKDCPIPAPLHREREIEESRRPDTGSRQRRNGEQILVAHDFTRK